MGLPNFLHLGPAKAGSTWVHETLGRHPDIFMAEAKDLHFFDRYFSRGLEWYANQFREALPEHRIVGEVCQSYLSNQQAPERIHTSLGPDVRLMVTLRDPVERAFSHYRYAIRQGKRLGTFQDALRSRRSLITQSRYGSQLRRYLRYFDKANIYVAVFDDLRSDPQAFLDHLLAWLDVPAMELQPAHRAARLPASRPRSTPAAGAVRRAAKWARDRDAAALVGRLKRSALVERLLYTPIAEADSRPGEREVAYIRARLDKEIATVEENFGLRLRDRWGWEDPSDATGPWARPTNPAS